MGIILNLILICLTSVFMLQGRNLKVTVYNKNGKPVKSVRMETLQSGIKASTDKDGICIFPKISEQDTLLVIIPGSSVAGLYPVKDHSELQFNTSKSELVAYDPLNRTFITGEELKIIRKGDLNIEKEILNGATNLEDILKRMPSLMVTGGEISLRNPVQTAEFSNTSPLIVVDGFVVRGGLAEANRTVNIQTIESIVIERDGTLYGREAVNGVIVIKLMK